MVLFPAVPNINDILYKEFSPLNAEDIAAAALYALQAPPHVNVNEIILNPIEGESIPRPKQFQWGASFFFIPHPIINKKKIFSELKNEKFGKKAWFNQKAKGKRRRRRKEEKKKLCNKGMYQ